MPVQFNNLTAAIDAFAAGQAPQAPTPPASISAALRQAIERQEAEHAQAIETLQAKLAEAQAEEASCAQLADLAEKAYRKAGPEPPVDLILKLQARNDDAVAATGRVAAIRAEIEAAERQYAAAQAEMQRTIADSEALRHDQAQRAEQERRRALVAQVWAPTVEELVPIVRDLVVALRAQARAWDRLVYEQANGLVADRDATQLVMPDSRTSDNLLPFLRDWLRKVEALGYGANEAAQPASEPAKSGKGR